MFSKPNIDANARIFGGGREKIGEGVGDGERCLHISIIIIIIKKPWNY